jgi:hypothetical protein
MGANGYKWVCVGAKACFTWAQMGTNGRMLAHVMGYVVHGRMLAHAHFDTYRHIWVY